MRSALRTCLPLLLLATAAIPWSAGRAEAQSDALPAYLRDRGTGMPTSMFGTYIHKGELLVYPFFEYYLDKNFEYKPSELGYAGTNDFRGEFRASEGLIYLGYGITDWLMIEGEAAYIDARLETAAQDNTPTPDVIKEKGTGDVEGQIRARFMRETETAPEVFGFFEAVSPQQKDKPLIGTPDWELKAGAGLIRGFSFGTMTVRAAGVYTLENSAFDPGEYALEYLRRVSPQWRLYAGVEGTQDEVGLITEVQWHFAERAYLKLNNSFGITSKATDWAPEVGILFSIPTGAN